LYLKKGAYPSWFDFDYFNGTLAPLSTLHLDNPAHGVWYIGTYGYRGNGFSIVAETKQAITCANDCSGSAHGTCNGNRCACTSDYSGSACERKKTPLELRTKASGYVAPTNWNYYRFTVQTTNNVLVQVFQTSDSGDCDMFIKSGQDPTRQEYDYADLSFNKNFSITIEEPGFVEWHVGVYGWMACSYDIVVSIPSECSCALQANGGHGHCEQDSDVCICDNGWVGTACDQKTDIIQSGEVITGLNITTTSWNYFRLYANTSLVSISLREQQTVGVLWLFASQKKNPTLGKHEEADMNTNTNFHEVHFAFKSQKQRVFYIGVYGSIYVPEGAAAGYSITAWAAPF